MSSFTMSCSCGKRGYRSEQSAKRAHRSASFRMKVYRCPTCKEWHVTNRDKR